MKSKTTVCVLGWMLVCSLCGCGGMNEVPLESEQAYNNSNTETPIVQNKEQDSSEGNIEMNGENSGVIEDKLLLDELMYGNIGKTLGLGTLAYAMPQSSEEDYKVYFFASENDEERYLSFEERKIELADAAYVFPDAREGNASIGKFQEIYCCELEDISGDGIVDILLVARYEIGDKVCYDTRVYAGNEGGYTLDSILSQELNVKYCDVEEYPVGDVLELSHD